VRKLNRTIKHFKKEPFFGVVQFNTTHYPYEIPEKYNKWTETFSDSYDNAVRYQDELIKLFFENLKAQGLMDNTIVFITSDHGESLMEHRTIGHVESNYTEAISVPLITYIPKGILNKTETKNLKKNLHQLTSNIDIAPTLFDLFDLEKEPSLNRFYSNYSGFSLLKPIPNKRTVISLNNNQVANFNTGISIAQKEWHYLFRTNIVPNKEEFYFWRKDVGELKNKSKSLTKTQRIQILKLVEKYPVCDKLREKAGKNY
jgi:arylsulfatase A-like enzyme